MNLDWQTIVALAIVAGAVAYLTRIVFKRMTGAAGGGCGSCSQRGSTDSVQQLPLVHIDVGDPARDTDPLDRQMHATCPPSGAKEKHAD